MILKQAIAYSIIKIGGLISQNMTISLIKETNAIRLAPFEWLSEFLKYHCSSRDIAQYIDIGTNDGSEMSLLLDKIGPFNSVHAIEPNPDIANKLSQNFPQVSVHQVALGQADALAKLVIPLDVNGNQVTEAATIVTNLSCAFKDSTSWEVQIKHPQSLDIDWETPSLIKIDAEGAELMILDALLPFVHPKSIICVEDHWAILDKNEQTTYQKDFGAIIKKLKAKGILFTKWM